MGGVKGMNHHTVRNCPTSHGQDMTDKANVEWCKRRQGKECVGCEHYDGEKVKAVNKHVQERLF